MPSLRWIHLGGFLFCAGMALSAQQVDHADFLQKARHAYYSLSAERMSQFQSSLAPNWRLLLEEQKLAPDVVSRAEEKLNSIRFTLTVDRQGVATITHTTVSAENDQVATGLKQVYDGMEQMTTGFFQTWCAFMVTPPLPSATTPFHLDQMGAWYTLTYQDGAAKVETTLGKDFAVSAMKVVTKDFNSTITPTFSRGPKGFVLVGYQATYRTTTASEATDLKVLIQNQDADGFTLPSKMDLRGTYGSIPFHVEVSFGGVRASKY